MKNKIIILIISIFFLLIASICLADDRELCTKNCSIINVTVDVINSTTGELVSNDFDTTVWIDNRGTGQGHKGSMSASIIPTEYEVTSNLRDSKNYARLKSYNDAIFSSECSGLAEVGKTYNCLITYQDNGLRFGWKYTMTTPGYYKETAFEPLTSSCTYMNRAKLDYSGSIQGRLIEIPVSSPFDNIVGCDQMKTEDQIKTDNTNLFIQEIDNVIENEPVETTEKIASTTEQAPTMVAKSLSEMNREELLSYLLRLILQLLIQGKLNINNF